MIQLSNSSLKKYQSCQRKFWHHKIGGTVWDTDAPKARDTTAMRTGNAVHEILERTGHDPAKFTESLFEAAVDKYDTVTESKLNRHLIYAMVDAYYPFHVESKLKVVAVEFKIDVPDLIGFLDIVLVDANLNWWIVDVKTWAQGSAVFKAGGQELIRDSQINLYANYVPEIAQATGLSAARFAGCMFRAIKKSKAVAQKRGGELETYEAYAKRVKIEIFDILVPKKLLAVDQVKGIHSEVVAEISENESEEAFLQNFGACIAYNKPCEYWSKCFGVMYSEIELQKYTGGDRTQEAVGTYYVRGEPDSRAMVVGLLDRLYPGSNWRKEWIPWVAKLGQHLADERVALDTEVMEAAIKQFKEGHQ